MKNVAESDVNLPPQCLVFVTASGNILRIPRTCDCQAPIEMSKSVKGGGWIHCMNRFSKLRSHMPNANTGHGGGLLQSLCHTSLRDETGILVCKCRLLLNAQNPSSERLRNWSYLMKCASCGAACMAVALLELAVDILFQPRII